MAIEGGIRNAECGKYEKAQGLCMRSNLILFVLVNQNFIGDEDEKENDDQGGSCRAVAQRAKAAHLTSDL